MLARAEFLLMKRLLQGRERGFGVMRPLFAAGPSKVRSFGVLQKPQAIGNILDMPCRNSHVARLACINKHLLCELNYIALDS